jgi:signal transduction histidine kinase
MTADELKALVTSRKSADRRLAARELAANPKAVDRALIEAAFHQERIPQIRLLFTEAIRTLDQGTASPEPAATQAKEIYDDAYVSAVRRVTERVLHQLSPLIGDIEHASMSEIPQYDPSQTKICIGQLKLQIDAISKLYHSSKPAKYEEFDVAALVRNCLPHDLNLARCDVKFAGTTPLMVHGDPSLITIAVTNGLRNAIEASLPVATDDRKPSIIINWDVTDRDHWISILDEGVGYTGSIPGAFEIGQSTKPGHSGNGLPAVKAAMLSLSGHVELIPQKDAGCVLQLTWPILTATT